MSQISYHSPGTKTPDGQKTLPQMIGTPWLANGIYPGWQAGGNFSLIDPRDPAPDKDEVGRGALSPAAGRFNAVRLTKGGVCLEYEVAGVPVREWLEARSDKGERAMQRRFRIEPTAQTLWLILGKKPKSEIAPVNVALAVSAPGIPQAVELVEQPDGLFLAHVYPSREPIEFRVAIGLSSRVKSWEIPRDAPADAPAPPRWSQTLMTRGAISSATNAYVVDKISLPLDNPWRRSIRLSDLAFF